MDDLLESHPLEEAASDAGMATIQLITPGWGSSGFYSADVLNEAASSRVFPAGTHMHIDHPAGDGSGVDENGNRSVRDLAAVLTEDARTDPSGGLVAEARVFGAWRPILADLKDDIGVSVRARGTAEIGEAEGRRGLVVTSIDEGICVDFVVAAGRGGRILELAESAKALSEANVNDTRDALQTEIGETYGGDENTCVWVRDFDPESHTVHFEVNRRGDCSLYSQSYTQADDGTCELQGEATEVTAQTVYVTVTAPDPDAAVVESDTTDNTDIPSVPATPIQEDHMTDIPGAGTAPPTNPRQVLEQGLAETRRQVALLQARDRARMVIRESLSSAWLPASTVTRLEDELIESIPMVDDHLDETALRDRATTKRDIAETEMAEALKAAGVGSVQGFGTQSNTGASVDRVAVEANLEESFLRMGMSASAAKIAAKGR